MLRIILKEFKCWQNLTIDIPLGGITLIKGDSGCGKSTILRSILWCLYGKIQSVTPITKKTANTEVTLQFPFHFNGKNDILNISRTKSTRVILSHSNNMYEDKVAQEIINDLFGTYDLWLASCYVGQGTRNTFLTAPNSGKMELLNSIAFHEEDPREFIDKINDVLNEKTTIYNLKLSDYNNNISSLELSLSKIDINNALSKEDHQKLLNNIKLFNDELSKLHQLKKQHDIDIGIINSLHNQLNNIKDVTIPELDNNLRELMTKYDYKDEAYDYNKINNIISLLKQRNELSTNKDLPNFSIQDYNDTVNNENTYNYNFNLLKLLNCNYDKESIDFMIKNIENTISYNEYYQINKEYQTLINNNIQYMDTNELSKDLINIKNNIKEAELVEIPNLDDLIPKPDYSKYDISILENQIFILRQKLSQPLINKNIDACNDIKQKINFLYNELKILKQNNDVNLLNIKISDLKDKQNNLNNEIYKLGLNNKILKCPKCSESLNFQKDELVICDDNLLKSNYELTTKQNEFNTISDDIDLITKQIVDIKNNLDLQIDNVNNKIKTLSDQLISYEKEYDILKINYTKEINNEIYLVNKQINDLKLEEQRIKLSYEKNISNKKAQLLYEKQNKITKLKDDYNKLELKITKVNSDNNIHLNNQKQIKILEEKLIKYKDLEDDNIKILTQNEINDLKNKLIKLNNIKIIQQSFYKSDYILNCINYNNVNNKIPLRWRDKNFIKVKFYNDKVNEYINLCNISKNDKIRADLSRKSINDQINNIKIKDDPIFRINELINIVNEYNNKINLSDEANTIINCRDNLLIEREKIMIMNNELVNLQLLKQHALETECKNLQDVISSINSSIENVCSTLFDKEISIILSLFKTIKSTKSVKPHVNFQISYKGGVFDNINDISGGEGDRTSIALTLALYRLTSFPLLMLDETLASLHYDMKEATVETLAGIIDKNRCVIIVLHDSVNGIFENVIDLDEITEGRY